LDGIICYIGIGSNLGDSLKNCKNAVKNISRIKGIELTAVSSFYKTEPVGMENQNYFTNAVAEIRTEHCAQDLLHALQNIENEMGRERGVKGGPRIIDLDLLFYGQNVISQPGLIVPHPEIQKRRFVLEPLCEIASYFIHPSFGVSVRGLKDRLSDNKIVEMIKE
jgi:2-amino-4-hydroxy-6-hydroxymethyldihydropteridine diphosphokinase